MLGKAYLFYLLLIVLRCYADDSKEDSKSKADEEDDENRTGKRLQNKQDDAPTTTTTKRPNPWPESSSTIAPYPPTEIVEENRNTSASSKATQAPSTAPPSIPRPPHFTAGSFFIGFFVAMVTVGLVFAGVRLFMRHRAEPRAYTMY